MKNTARFYLCARCRSQVFICTRCDRGQVYCNRDCAAQARKLAQCEANKRYRKTYRARVLNAERQRRHRTRRASQPTHKVTYQGSLLSTASATSLSSADDTAAFSQPAKPVLSGLIQCHFCEQTCADRVRSGFLPRSYRRHRQPP